MEQGVHLLVEKPIASTTREAEELVALAQAKGVILQVGHVERFNPVMRFLEDHIAQPRFIEAMRLAPFPPPRQALWERRLRMGPRFRREDALVRRRMGFVRRCQA